MRRLLILFLAACGGNTAMNDAADDAGSPDASTDSLCGAATSPCVVRRDEVISPQQMFRNDAPSIAVGVDGEPRVAFTSSVGVPVTSYATRSAAGAWSSEPLPVASGLAALVLEDDATPLVLVEDGSVWRGAGTWVAQEPFPDGGTGWSSGFARDAAGGLHALAIDELFRPIYGSFTAGSWHTVALDPTSNGSWAFPASLALAPGGEAHTLFWRSTVADWTLIWQPALGAAGPVGSFGSSILNLRRTGLAATSGPGGDRIHALFDHASGPASVTTTYAVKAPGGGWTLHDVAVGDSEDLTTYCGTPPPPGGATCEFSYTYYRQVALAAADDAARVLYARFDRTGPATVVCQDPEHCMWFAPPGVAGSLWVAMLDGGGAIRTAEVLAGVAPQAARAVVDAGGRIHIAFYEGQDADTTVRYLLVGP